MGLGLQVVQRGRWGAVVRRVDGPISQLQYGISFVTGSGFWKAMRFFAVSKGIVTIE